MFKNQLQELAQRSCFNLPSYACIREGPDHAPRFKASVNFNGEIFESPSYCNTLRQAEHTAAEVALNVLSSRGPSRSLTARVLDETGIYKNLLQETAHRAGLNLPVYTTVRSGPGHVPIFSCTVELAGMSFTGEPAKTKKQAEKNAAIAAWSALKKIPNLDSLTNRETDNREEQDQAVVARVLSNLRPRDDGKQARKRDHNQARRRPVRGFRDNNSSASSSNNSLLYQNWRLLDLLLDSALDGSTQKRNSFVSLVPPPPPRTSSKILPPTSTRENPCPYPSNRPLLPIWGKSQVNAQEVSITREEHRKDEEEWLMGAKPEAKDGPSNINSSDVLVSSSMYRQFPVSGSGKIGTSLLDSTSSKLESSRRLPSPMTSTTTSIKAQLMGRPIYTGGFNPQRIAPAVQIRSVIPVCAAPPPASTTSTTGASTSKSTKTGESSPPTEQLLGSEFNKKLQL